VAYQAVGIGRAAFWAGSLGLGGNLLYFFKNILTFIATIFIDRHFFLLQIPEPR
jgi:hypothetical protein